MTKQYMTSKNKKKQRLKITNLNDLKQALLQEGYTEIDFEENTYKDSISKNFKVENSVIDMMYETLNKSEVTYRADNVKNFIEYMENIYLFQNEHNKLIEKIKDISKLNIDRVEYERIITTQDNVNHMINDIERIKKEVSMKINEKDIYRIEDIEKQLDNDHVYTRDI